MTLLAIRFFSLFLQVDRPDDGFTNEFETGLSLSLHLTFQKPRVYTLYIEHVILKIVMAMQNNTIRHYTTNKITIQAS
jgi:hypothetical protein